jgi:hypothetical protein
MEKANSPLSRLHGICKTKMEDNYDTLSLLAPDQLLNQLNQLRERLNRSNMTEESSGTMLSDIEDMIIAMFSIIHDLRSIAPNVKLERARKCHINGTPIRMYNGAVSQHLDETIGDTDRAALSPFFQ